MKLTLLGAVIMLTAISDKVANASPIDDQQSYAAEITSELGSLKNLHPLSCSDLSKPMTTAGNMKAQVDAAYTNQNSSEVTPLDREEARAVVIQGTPIFLGAYLDIADTALAGKCLDEADKVYRDVVRTYTGEAYSGFRDRARIGIDDVRAARPK